MTIHASEKSEVSDEPQHVEAMAGDTQETTSVSSDIYFPDGGYRAWLTVCGGFLGFFASIGFLSSFSVFQSYYTTTTLPTYSPSDISWIGSLQIWGCFFMALWSGRFSDQHGPRIPLAIGGFMMVFGTMMASISKKYYQFILSQGLCSAIGFGFVFTPALAVQSQWFLKRRGFVVGLVMSGQNVGGVIWPVIVNRLITYHGISLGWTLRIIGFIQLATMVAATLLVHARFPHIPREAIPFRRFITDKRSALFTLSTVVAFFGIYVPYFYLSPYAIRWGASASAAFYDAAILNGGAFFGCYAFGIISDCGVGRFNALTAVTFGCAVIGFGWIGVRDNAGIIVWSVFYGFVSGAVQALFSPCVSHLAPTPALIGTWNGLCITPVAFAVLGCGPIAGRLLENTGGVSYTPMQGFTGAMLLAASILYAATRVLISRKMRV